jgi:enamine deaminase RidA (YjgF/YER057c/UK114 family)
MHNVQTALEACEATFENVVKLSIYIVQGQNLYGAFGAAQKFMNQVANPPAITVLTVAGLANPEYLIEMDAIAFIPR